MDQNHDSQPLRAKLFDMVSTGVVGNRLNQGYDIISTLMLLLNLVVAFASTFDNLDAAYGHLFDIIESVTVFFFAVDYVLRLITADYLYPGCDMPKAMRKYMTSAFGVIDLLSFLPYYLPTFFPAGAAAFRMLRVVRIFRLFRINAYSDSLTVIGNVLSGKKTQILASMFIIVMLILASSLCMYSVEHEAQPDVFENGFSAIWWATSTLLTVGYGDIYPITALGKMLGIAITFLGVGLVAIPTGIISAGFIEESQKMQRMAFVEEQQDIHFIEVKIKEDDLWTGRMIKDLGMPQNSLIVVIIRDGDAIIPRGDVTINAGDRLIICSDAADEVLEYVKEIVLHHNHPWNGLMIRDLDISRQTIIVLVNRNGKVIIPTGKLILYEGDRLLVFSKESIAKYNRELLF